MKNKSGRKGCDKIMQSQHHVTVGASAYFWTKYLIFSSAEGRKALTRREAGENAVDYYSIKTDRNCECSTISSHLQQTPHWWRKLYDGVDVIIHQLANTLLAKAARFNPALMLRCAFGLCVIKYRLCHFCCPFAISLLKKRVVQDDEDVTVCHFR